MLWQQWPGSKPEAFDWWAWVKRTSVLSWVRHSLDITTVSNILADWIKWDSICQIISIVSDLDMKLQHNIVRFSCIFRMRNKSGWIIRVNKRIYRDLYGIHWIYIGSTSDLDRMEVDPSAMTLSGAEWEVWGRVAAPAGRSEARACRWRCCHSPFYHVWNHPPADLPAVVCPWAPFGTLPCGPPFCPAIRVTHG